MARGAKPATAKAKATAKRPVAAKRIATAKPKATPKRPGTTKRPAAKRAVTSKPVTTSKRPGTVRRPGTSKARTAPGADRVRALEQRLVEALEQQTATSDILRVISHSQTDVQPVFDTIATSAARLCEGEFCHVFRFDGTLIHYAASDGLSPEGLATIRNAYPMPPGRGSAAARSIASGRVEHIPDVATDPDYAHRTFAKIMTFRSIVAVPMLRDGVPIGAIAVARSQAGIFPTRQIELLRTFADQAVIAIDNVRLFTELEARNRDLTQSLEQQTATSDILRVISQSPTDVSPVFDTIAQSAMQLCAANVGLLTTFDGELVHVAAMANATPEGSASVRRAFPRKPSNDNASARAVYLNRVVVIPDIMEDADYTVHTNALAGGFRSILSVPLTRDGAPIGAITVGRPDPGPFSEREIALLRTFADQAVIAIENVRLFTELGDRNRDLTDALEQQNATSEILSVISKSPTDVQPAFDTIAMATLKLCGASNVNVFTFDGELIHLAALVNPSPAGAEALRALWPQKPSRGMAAARAILTGRMVQIPDVLEDPDFSARDAAIVGNFRSILAVPLMREGRPIGAIAVGRPEAGPFSASQGALLETFADQAVIAIENVRLFRELEARTAQLTRSVGELKALGEVGQAVSSTLDLETVLRTIVARATELAGMDGGSIYEYDEPREVFHLHTTYRLPAEVVDALRASPIPKGEGALGQLAVTGDVVQIGDISDEAVYKSRVRKMLLRSGYRSLLAVPLLREDRLLGGLVVNRATPGEFAPEVIDLLKTFATQSALAIQNARLFHEIGDKSRQLEVASRHKSEFLANMSHELRTPLNAIIGFSEVLADRMFGEINDKQEEYLNDILESGRHLLALINDILDLSKIEAGRMELDLDDFNLPAAIDNTVTLIRERAHRRGITLERAIGERVGVIRADERKVKQVLLNLLSNALKFTPEGGRISVHSDVRDSVAEISVTDTGIGIAPEDQATVFEEFRQVGTRAKKVEGTGLGLAISRKFIELHGGRIWVTSTVGVGSTFAFTLPLLPAS